MLNREVKKLYFCCFSCCHCCSFGCFVEIVWRRGWGWGGGGEGRERECNCLLRAPKAMAKCNGPQLKNTMTPPPKKKKQTNKQTNNVLSSSSNFGPQGFLQSDALSTELPGYLKKKEKHEQGKSDLVFGPLDNLDVC